jgi:hypothetical protein
VRVGPSRTRAAQHHDIDAGARRPEQLLGDRVAPIFTPPWNRCTADTGRCLIDLGFQALSREHKAAPLNLAGLKELPVHVDWCKPDREERLAKELQRGGPVGVMFHHAEMDAAERARVGHLLALLSAHPRVRARPMAALV